MRTLIIFFFIVISSHSYSQIQFETDTLIRGVTFPFNFVKPVKSDTLLLRFVGCKGRIVSDSLGMVKADSLSKKCWISIFNVIHNDTSLYATNALTVENIKKPKFLLGGVDIMNLNQKKVIFENFALNLKNITQPKLIRLSYFLSEISVIYNGIDKIFQRNDFLRLQNLFCTISRTDTIVLKSLFFKGPFKRGTQEIVINKSFTRTGFRKNKFIIENVN